MVVQYVAQGSVEVLAEARRIGQYGPEEEIGDAQVWKVWDVSGITVFPRREERGGGAMHRSGRGGTFSFPPAFTPRAPCATLTLHKTWTPVAQPPPLARWTPISSPPPPMQELAQRIFCTAYMGTVNSSSETRNRYFDLAHVTLGKRLCNCCFVVTHTV